MSRRDRSLSPNRNRAALPASSASVRVRDPVRAAPERDFRAPVSVEQFEQPGPEELAFHARIAALPDPQRGLAAWLLNLRNLYDSVCHFIFKRRNDKRHDNDEEESDDDEDAKELVYESDSEYESDDDDHYNDNTDIYHNWWDLVDCLKYLRRQHRNNPVAQRDTVGFTTYSFAEMLLKEDDDLSSLVLGDDMPGNYVHNLHYLLWQGEQHGYFAHIPFFTQPIAGLEPAPRVTADDHLGLRDVRVSPLTFMQDLCDLFDSNNTHISDILKVGLCNRDIIEDVSDKINDELTRLMGNQADPSYPHRHAIGNLLVVNPLPAAASSHSSCASVSV